MITRRHFVAGAAAAGALAGPARSLVTGDLVAGQTLPLTVAARSPWMSNGVALTRANQLFLSLPRFPGHMDTPSLARREADGSIVAFPGGGWNAWRPGDDGQNAFVYVNAIHIFHDDTLWCVDQGALRGDPAPPGAQKLVRIAPRTGKILDIIRFDAETAPPGAKINDLRIYGDLIYMTDSGLGALIVYDVETRRFIRRLSGYRQLLATPRPEPVLKPGQPKILHVTPKSDLIEVSPDGLWLYWASPTGPFRRIPTKLLCDTSIPDAELATHIEVFLETPLIGGSIMDTRGNLYITDMHHHRVLVCSPTGQQAVIAAGDDFISPDAPFITADRHLYVPMPQTDNTSLFGHPDITRVPFLTYAMPLPEVFQGIVLGDALTGTTALRAPGAPVSLPA